MCVRIQTKSARDGRMVVHIEILAYSPVIDCRKHNRETENDDKRQNSHAAVNIDASRRTPDSINAKFLCDHHGKTNPYNEIKSIICLVGTTWLQLALCLAKSTFLKRFLRSSFFPGEDGGDSVVPY